METLARSLEILFTTPAIPAAFAGVAWGILGGALPGISPSITMALLLPFTYTLDPTSAIVLLAATYVGAEYGGSIPAVLIRTPGTNAAAATVLDGYEMNKQGKAGLALGISLYSGVIGSLFGLAMLAAFISGCAAGLLRGSSGVAVILLVSVGSGLLHRYVVSPPTAGPPILPPIVVYVALGMAVLTVALLGFALVKAARRVRAA